VIAREFLLTAQTDPKKLTNESPANAGLFLFAIALSIRTATHSDRRQTNIIQG
jgi:hypothetical protein